MLIQTLFRQKSDLVIHGDVAAGGGLGGIVRGVIHLDFAVADLLQNGVVLVQGESAEVPACFVGGQANIVALFQAKVAVGASMVLQSPALTVSRPFLTAAPDPSWRR